MSINNEVFVQFILEGFSKNPSFITGCLDINPSQIWLSGDLKNKNATLKYKTNGWKLEIKKKNIFHIDTVLREMINILMKKKEVLSNLNNISKRINIIVYTKKVMPSFIYDDNIISFLYETGISLEQDIYCMAEK